ncbi:archaemetzincin [Fulvivirgaceae bacterium PWU4]|uniref:Archaemetzincin n=1 Tax=Chryseosolibacter histidini TaxID=2782349 RepID=A0AAP2DGZ8_9BACT|nr:matrixin family metalloprotease [Chryseosolibacter histidini]MBT1696056.1 archaemetzincin [Chryseosolibacter histidini]
MRPLIVCILLSLWSCSTDETIKVGIQPFENFDRSLTDTVLNALANAYEAKVYVLDHKPLPEEAFINVKSPRYRADKLIAIMKMQKPDSLDYIISLTDKDISTTKWDYLGRIKEPESKYSDWGVFGLGYRPGPSCIVSTYRLKNTDQRKFIERLKKVAIHELGHNLGLDHCESELCVMRDAVETIKTIDRVDPKLCGQCKKRIGFGR